MTTRAANSSSIHDDMMYTHYNNKVHCRILVDLSSRHRRTLFFFINNKKICERINISHSCHVLFWFSVLE